MDVAPSADTPLALSASGLSSQTPLPQAYAEQHGAPLFGPSLQSRCPACHAPCFSVPPLVLQGVLPPGQCSTSSGPGKGHASPGDIILDRPLPSPSRGKPSWRYAPSRNPATFSGQITPAESGPAVSNWRRGLYEISYATIKLPKDVCFHYGYSAASGMAVITNIIGMETKPCY